MRCRPAALTPYLAAAISMSGFHWPRPFHSVICRRRAERLLEVPDLGLPEARQLLRFGGALLLRRDLVSRDDAVGHQGRGEGLVHGERQHERPGRDAGRGALGDHARRGVELARAGEVGGGGTGALTGALSLLLRVAQLLLEHRGGGVLGRGRSGGDAGGDHGEGDDDDESPETHKVLSTWCPAGQRRCLCPAGRTHPRTRHRTARPSTGKGRGRRICRGGARGRLCVDPPHSEPDCEARCNPARRTTFLGVDPAPAGP